MLIDALTIRAAIPATPGSESSWANSAVAENSRTPAHDGTSCDSPHRLLAAHDDHELAFVLRRTLCSWLRSRVGVISVFMHFVALDPINLNQINELRDAPIWRDSFCGDAEMVSPVAASDAVTVTMKRCAIRARPVEQPVLA
jgi:hypothetical protein